MATGATDGEACVWVREERSSPVFSLPAARAGHVDRLPFCGACTKDMSAGEAAPPHPFSEPFEVSASDGALWISPFFDRRLRTRLHIKGANWAGMQADGCPHALWNYGVADYIAFLVEHDFNTVRLPLSGVLINANAPTDFWGCGEYNGWAPLAILDDVLLRLEAAGIFVVLDMHNMAHPEYNQGLWCGEAPACNPTSELELLTAWQTLADRYCDARPNVIGADLFNEPYSASWGVGNADYRWDLGATRLGNGILERCDRWLIFVEGVAQNGGGYGTCAPYGCWWGENIQGAVAYPIVLRNASRLVYSPHVYGHGNHPYMRASNFPANMPPIWWQHFGRVPSQTGVPIVLGEWGGIWDATVWNGRSFPTTKWWQQELTNFLVQHEFGYFYWTLNDNSFRTGSLFNDYTGASAVKLGMLNRTASTLMRELAASWRAARGPAAPPHPPRTPSPPRIPPSPPPLLPQPQQPPRPPLPPPPSPAPPLYPFPSPPPVPPPLDLASFEPATVVAVTMSTTYNGDFVGSRCIDGSLTTLCATSVTSDSANWIAVRLAAGTRVGPVALYNRRDGLGSWLGSVEVWAGGLPGDAANLCGTASYTASAEPEPYLLSCADAAAGLSTDVWITIRQVECMSTVTCIVSLAEINVYLEPLPPPVPSPPFPPALPPPPPSAPPSGSVQAI